MSKTKLAFTSNQRRGLKNKMDEKFPLPILFDKVHVAGGNIAAGDYKLVGQTLVGDKEQRLTHPNPSIIVSLVTPGIASLALQTDKTIKNLPQAVAWGVAGAIFGPVGIAAGFIFGGYGAQVCSLVTLKDGREFLIVTSEKVYDNIVALASLSQATVT